MPDPEIIEPAREDQIDLADDLLRRVRTMTSEDLPKFLQQLRALVARRRILWPPGTMETAHLTELKPQEGKRLPALQIHHPALLSVHRDAELR